MQALWLFWLELRRPLFLFSVTFYSISVYPRVIAGIVQRTPSVHRSAKVPCCCVLSFSVPSPKLLRCAGYPMAIRLVRLIASKRILNFLLL